jgi:hypothetical protein
MKRVPCLSCGVVVSNIGGVEISVRKFGGGIRRTQHRVTVTGECPACGADLSEHGYKKNAIIDD